VLALALAECQLTFESVLTVPVGQQTKKGKRMKFRPLHDRVLVRRIEAEEKTAGGIIIPDTAKEKPQEGEVVSVGEGAYNEDGERIKPDVKKGDKILFGKWSGTEVKINGEDLLIMKESDVLGIIG
jgi:chaperonin GroES